MQNQKFFQNSPEVICGRIFMKLGPIKAELNEILEVFLNMCS